MRPKHVHNAWPVPQVVYQTVKSQQDTAEFLALTPSTDACLTQDGLLMIIDSLVATML